MGQLSLLNPERAERDRILDAHNDGDNGPLLDRLRERLVQRYYSPEVKVWRDDCLEGYFWITADHARPIIDEEGWELDNLNFMGALFRPKGWVTDGTRVPSRTPGSHARVVLRWRWIG